MAIVHYAVCTKNLWKLGSTLDYINIMQPVDFNVFLHANILQCKFNREKKYSKIQAYRILSIIMCKIKKSSQFQAFNSNIKHN